jgi:hypothetical protein
MGQILKFIYALITFISIFLSVTYCGGSRIESDDPVCMSFLHSFIKFYFISYTQYLIIYIYY